MAGRRATAVLGFRPHTYWTAALAMSGPADAPQVLERRRLVFAAGGERFAYHQAAGVPPDKAEALIEAIRATTEATVARDVGALVADLEREGVAVEAAVAPARTAKLPGELAAILRVHSLQHAAEGDFYRDVVAAGCAAVGLKVLRVAERDLAGRVAARLGTAKAELDERLKAMGAALGPPWGEDYRLAALAAWSDLEA